MVLTAGPDCPAGPAGPEGPFSPFPPAGPRSPLAPVWPSAPCRGTTVLYVQELYGFPSSVCGIARLQLGEYPVSEKYWMSYRGSSESRRSSRSNLSALTLCTDSSWSVCLFMLAKNTHHVLLIHVIRWIWRALPRLHEVQRVQQDRSHRTRPVK